MASPGEPPLGSEARARVELAAAHKLVRLYGMDELVWNHLSMRLEGDAYLITPGDKLYDEIEPSDLMVKSSGNVTADIIHGAIYTARGDVRAVVHLHTPAAVTVSCLESGFECFAQDSAPFFESVAYHDWEGVSDDPSEAARIGAAVKGSANTLLMRNHGFCTMGATVGEAWVLAYYFELSCKNQLALLATRQPLIRPDIGLWQKAWKQSLLPEFRAGRAEWPALLRLAGAGPAAASRGQACFSGVGGAAAAIAGAAGELGDEESKLRAELAVAYRLNFEFGMDQLVWNHTSARLADGSVLITPGSKMCYEMRPSDLVKTSLNVTGDIIHTAIYTARPDVKAVVHLHTPAAVAMACLARPFAAVAQHAAGFYGRVAYHDWEGISDDPAEGPRMGAAVAGEASILLMRSHGFCALGASVAEAWVSAYYFERSCETQLLALQSGVTLREPSTQLWEHALQQFQKPGFRMGDSEWAALTRLAKRPRRAPEDSPTSESK